MTFPQALFSLVVGVTAMRFMILAVTPTDLFFDEAQYWFWGQELAFGYYSKPPLIGWVIRGVTELAGSIEPFWVRAAAPIFHGLTAVVLALWTRRVAPEAAFWAAAIYLSMPMTAIGSWMMSTDTVLAPFFAAALWAWWRHCDTRQMGPAVAAGVLIGVAMLAKYAAIYFWIGAALATLVGLRPTRHGALAAALAFGVVVSPNVVWNIANDLTTVSHTLDNADWVRQSSGPEVNIAGLIEFLASQAGVFGPVFLVILMLALIQSRGSDDRWFLAFALPVLIIVSLQAVLSKAFANWAFTAYLSAVPLVAIWLVRRGAFRWLWVGLGLNVAVSLVLSVLIVWPDVSPRIMGRYMDRAAIAEEALTLADGRIIVSDIRWVLAEVTYHAARTGREIEVLGATHAGPPRNFWEMEYPYAGQQPAVFIGRIGPTCQGIVQDDFGRLPAGLGEFSRSRPRVFDLGISCLTPGTVDD